MANDISSMASANSSSDLIEASGRETALHRSRMPLAGNDKPVGEQDQLDANKAALVDAKTVREQAKAEREAQKAELEKQVQELQDTASFKGWSVNFALDKELDRTVIRVVDSKTQEMIRQIPSEELLTIAKRLKELDDLSGISDKSVVGLLFDKKI